jgi:uncharacterized protein (TIGR02996 family)
VESAFLKHITDDPDDMVPRLVFADWLHDQHSPDLNERGEFIHLQHALSNSKVRPEDRKRLLARQKDLLTRHQGRWEESFRGLVKNCEYHNGFAERVTISVEQLFDGFADLVERTPVVRVKLSGLAPDTVPVIAELAALNQLRELDLDRRQIAPQVLRDFLSSPHLTRLRYLNLARTGVGDEGVRALLASDVFCRLRYLNLSHTGISVSGVRALVNAICNRTTDLQMLVLRGSPRVQPGAFPPLPDGLPFRLCQSLQSQLGLGVAPPQDLLTQLHASRATLTKDGRQLVDWLHTNGHAEVPRAVKLLPLPGPLRAAFTLVCERRALWRANQLGAVPLALPLEGDERTDLAATLRLLIGMAPTPAKETRALVECLLDLYLRHERGELPADGKTR